MNETPPEATTTQVSLPEPAPVKAPGALSERHEKYAEEFKQWMLGLNRHDFGQCRRVLEQMTKQYMKHTLKIHSPPMRDEKHDDSGKTSDGSAGAVLRDPQPPVQ